MLKNYFKLAWRNILKNRFYSAVNIIGLSVGIAFTMLIAAYVWGELQVNRRLKSADNQYIILGDWTAGMGNGGTTIAELPRALKQNYPNLVANYYRWDGVSAIVSNGDKHFTENFQIGDSTMLKMYGFKLLQGDVNTAFNEPFGAVITEATAIKYFGKTDVIGKTLSIANFANAKQLFTVSGVLQALPKNSVTDMFENAVTDVFLSTGALNFMQRNLEGWNNIYIVGLIELKPGVNPRSLDKPMLDLIKKNAPPQISDNVKPYLSSLTDYYRFNVKPMLYTLTYIGLFILLMAIINYVNMCISRSSTRLKEMGIRKVLGGMRRQLIRQFLAESVLLVAISTVVALLLYVVARPFFSRMLELDMAGLFAFPWYAYLMPFVFAVLVGLVAGIYPAVVLTALNTVDALKGKLASINEKVFLRKTLVGFQFGIAIVALISAIVVSQQISLFFGKDLGYDKDAVIYASVPRDWSGDGVTKMEAIRDGLKQTADVTNTSVSYSIPNGATGGDASLYKQGADVSTATPVTLLVTDNQYADTYRIPMRAGVFFSPIYKDADRGTVVINETQAKALGWDDVHKALGQQINLTGYPPNLTICGVIADHQFAGMRGKMPPMVFVNDHLNVSYRYLSIKLRAGNLQQRLAGISKTWAKLMPGAPFEYKFIDEVLANMYKRELQLQKAAYTATVLAIIIVLLGVLGLMAQSVQKRTKEIGIRKVLGSSAADISMLFLKDVLVVVLIAGLVACPVAWLVMHKWLSDYAYKISLSATPFLIAVMGLSLITAIVIILQTTKAALARPADSLRSE